MKEEQKKVSGDSPHRIVNFNRKNLTSKKALEESSLHRAGRGINKLSNRRSGAGKDVQGEAASLKTARSGKISITGRCGRGGFRATLKHGWQPWRTGGKGCCFL